MGFGKHKHTGMDKTISGGGGYEGMYFSGRGSFNNLPAQLDSDLLPCMYRPERLEKGGLCWLLTLMWMGTQRIQMKGVLPWLVHWACRGGTRDFLTFCPALAALVSPVQNNFFLIVRYFNSYVPIAQQVGQAAVLGRLSLGMCHWYRPCQLQDRLCLTKITVLSAPTPSVWRNILYSLRNFHHMYPLDGIHLIFKLSRRIGSLVLNLCGHNTGSE